MVISKKKKPKAPVTPTIADEFRAHLDALDAAREAEEELPEPEGGVASLIAYIETGVIVAYADGEIDEAETDRLMDAVITFVEGDWKTGQISALLDDLSTRLEEEGVDARLEAVAETLGEGGYDTAFDFACQVSLMSAGTDDEEDEALMNVAEAFGIDEEDAQERYAAMEEIFGS